ncbi:hypothetical protein E2C01_042544 [Portunus trituberculatus]|uniref:Uncharacterized protein n=1 Tax=Portunus trituberculatus TaxID=210409 RepID=A0A5B7FMP3_PORTR|nr:hypothetical protein [Portunus trituberculatus]
MTSVGGNDSGLDCQYRLMSFRSTVYRRSAIITSLMTHSGKSQEERHMTEEHFAVGSHAGTVTGVRQPPPADRWKQTVSRPIGLVEWRQHKGTDCCATQQDSR